MKYTDRAAKILEAPVILHKPLSLASSPAQQITLGFAYAGSSLIALQAYTAVLPPWSRLESSGPQELPSVQECAEHLRRFLAAYAWDIGSGGGEVGCQCVLVGYNRLMDKLDGWLIETKPSAEGVETILRQLNLSSSDVIEIFGSGGSIATEKLEKLYKDGNPWRREPLRMIRAFLGSDPKDDVGGGVQIGILNPTGFELYFDVQPFTAGSPVGNPLVLMKYRGFDWPEVGHVGGAFANLKGIA